MEIRTKKEFYKLWTAGVLGNATRLWSGPNAVLEACKSDVIAVGFREVGKAGGGRFVIVPRNQILQTACDWEHDGLKFNISEAAPDHLITLQGEVCRTYRGFEGMFSTNPGLRMREAMLIAKPFNGLAVKVILDRFMDPTSRDAVDELFELYPDAAVEFACYSRNVGTVPNRNTIIWEVRNY